MRIRQLDVNIETKSKDHVFLRVHISIQYQTNSTHLFESFYSLQSPIRQLTTQTHDILRSTLPQLDLDDIFSSQDSIALELHRSLNGNMNQYGYIIHHALICQIQPNDHVKQSMNEMEASKRLKEAMPEKAEAVRIEKVKDAEARAERAYLTGVGIARERRAIANGMREVVDSVISPESDDGDDKSSSSASVISPKGVMYLLVLTQYMDVMMDVNGLRGGTDDTQDGQEMPSSSLFLTHMPETVTQLTETAQRCFTSATSDTVKVENLLEL